MKCIKQNQSRYQGTSCAAFIKSLFGKTVDHLATPSPSATVDNFPCYQVRTMSLRPPHPAPKYEKKGKKKKGKDEGKSRAYC